MLNLRIYPDPVLREVSKPVESIDHGIQSLIEDMIETMKGHEGVGLAAPQVGILQRVIVIGIPDEEPIAIVNPELSKPIGEDLFEEGCLSLPGIRVSVKRATKVMVKGLSPEGKVLKKQAKDLFARVLQHEVDHLNGILLIDKLPKKERLEFELNYIRTISKKGVASKAPAMKL